LTQVYLQQLTTKGSLTALDGSPDAQIEIVFLRPLGLVYLCQELFLMLFHETGKNIFKIALVIENVTLSNPGL